MIKNKKKQQTRIENPDVKITLKELEEMQKSGNVDLDKVGQYLKQTFEIDEENS